MPQQENKSLQGQLNITRRSVPVPGIRGATEISQFIKLYSGQDISANQIRDKAKKGPFEIPCDDGSVIIVTLFRKTDSGRYLFTISLIYASFLEIAA